MDMKKVIAAAVGMLALNVGGMSLHAEDAAPPEPKPAVTNPPAQNPDNQQPGQDNPRRKWRNRENGGAGGAAAAGGDRGGQGGDHAGPGGAGGPGGRGFMRQEFGGDGGKSMMLQLASRMAGTPIEDPKTLAKEDALPLGGDRRFVLQIPVGGIDNFSGMGSGWKMEQVFPLTDEQTKAITSLRDEYTQKQKDFEAKIAAQQKALADEAKELRASFEKRANDVLTGADKEAKQKLDSLAQDAEKKNAAAAADELGKLEDNNPQQLLSMARTIREQTDKTIQDARKAMLDALPAEVRAKAEELFKEVDAQKANMDPQNWRGGRRGGGGGMRQNEQPQPKENKDF